MPVGAHLHQENQQNTTTPLNSLNYSSGENAKAPVKGRSKNKQGDHYGNQCVILSDPMPSSFQIPNATEGKGEMS